MGASRFSLWLTGNSALPMNKVQMNRSNLLLRAEASTSATPPVAPSSLVLLERFACLAGQSAAIQAVRAQMRRVSAHFRVALISGEPGTGKEVVAQALHAMSTRPEEPFLAQSAASFLARVPQIFAQIAPDRLTPERAAAMDGGLSGQLLTEEALNTASPGRCTLYLGELNALTRGEQMYLAETLRRLAASRLPMERPRLIFASERDLRTLTVAGQFDPGLYRKVSALEILLPPLRTRADDVPVIVAQMLAVMDTENAIQALVEKRALSRLQQYSWPGNVRELERVIELARLHAGDGMIEAMHLPSLGGTLHGPQAAAPHEQREEASDKLDDIVQSHVLQVLMRCSGNKVRAAERLGISRSTLYRMLEHGAGGAALERLSKAS
jgi:DNA-binding NtrC family response regulator